MDHNVFATQRVTVIIVSCVQVVTTERETKTSIRRHFKNIGTHVMNIITHPNPLKNVVRSLGEGPRAPTPRYPKTPKRIYQETDWHMGAARRDRRCPSNMEQRDTGSCQKYTSMARHEQAYDKYSNNYLTLSKTWRSLMRCLTIFEIEMISRHCRKWLYFGGFQTCRDNMCCDLRKAHQIQAPTATGLCAKDAPRCED